MSGGSQVSGANADAVGWDAHYATEAGARYWPNEELVRWISGRRFERAVEVGAGTGSNADLLLNHVGTVSLVEPNERAREILEARGYPAAEGEARDLRYYDGVFDLVVDCMTSQHIPWAEHRAVYREYARVLEVGGWLWLFHLDSGVKADSCWAPEGSEFDVSYIELFPSLKRFCLPTPAALIDSVRSAGFDDIERRGLRRLYPNGCIVSYTIIAARKA